METVLYNQKGEKKGKIKLPEEIFSVEASDNLIYQVANSQMSNRRQGTAHTKDRSEVSGGGKKPWRQKGTGRARHGSNRSPIWAGGGVTFGPRKEKRYDKKIPKKMRRKALFAVLSKKLGENKIIILDELKVEGKTKEMAEVKKSLPIEGGKVLFALPEYDKNIILASRNLKNLSVIEARELNVLDVLQRKFLVLTKKSIDKMVEVFVGGKDNLENKKRENKK